MNLVLAFLLLISSPDEKIKIKDPWMRVSAQGQTTALFMKIENPTDKPDTLYKVECDFVNKAEIHETYQQGEMMGMREVPFVVIQPKSTFELKPRAHHIMLIKLKRDLKKGDEGEIVLYFKNAGKITIKAKAQEMQMQKMEHKH
ncbi:MAG: copper chaperone PCu(A)C [Ignavibacterium album]|jgi:copper(I)-binding protein|uniref:Copper chaperone PCu(A)C n=1 Tax=Ignavibacterium album TaxID=591197 RepID=A0A7V3E6R9_9BACT|nr:copper chaperone PCu(A)C [Ignavibacterium album]MCX8105847.1 copper chaperone PCu(A)C [Ignavibacterium album]